MVVRWYTFKLDNTIKHNIIIKFLFRGDKMYKCMCVYQFICVHECVCIIACGDFFKTFLLISCFCCWYLYCLKKVLFFFFQLLLDDLKKKKQRKKKCLLCCCCLLWCRGRCFLLSCFAALVGSAAVGSSRAFKILTLVRSNLKKLYTTLRAGSIFEPYSNTVPGRRCLADFERRYSDLW